MNLIQWLVTEHIAKADRHAEHIIVLLGLAELHARGEYDEIMRRARVYRYLRDKPIELDSADAARVARESIGMLFVGRMETL